MNLFIATLGTETNTFASQLTQLSDFWVERPSDEQHGQRPLRLYTEALAIWRQFAADNGWVLTESLAAFA